MKHRRAFGAPPPQDRCTDAGDAEADSMIGRFGRTAHARAREAALLFLLAGLMAAPGMAAARTYTIIDPPPYQEGDPTADDQPSPTPKKTSALTMPSSTVATPTRHASTSVTPRRLYVSQLTWDLYLRILSRLIVR
jgi:hypothetical protein